MTTVMLRAALLLVLAGNSLTAQVTTTPRDQVRLLVQRVLPRWDSTILQVPAAENWSKGLSLGGVLVAVADSKAVPKDAPPRLDRLRLGESSVRVNAESGKLRYVNNERAWKPDTGAQRLSIDTLRAREVVLGVLQRLRIPQAEWGATAVVTQVGAAAPIDSALPTTRTEMYRVVTVARQINKIPVYDSRVLGAVNDGGMVQRLSANWPPFRLKPAMKVRSRAEVIEETVSQILVQSPSGKVQVQPRLVYAPRDDDDDNVTYVPSIVVAVDEPPTPYIIIVPVAR